MQTKHQAKKFIEEYDLRKRGVNIHSVTDAAISMGYEVTYFNPNNEMHIELLRKVTNNEFDNSKKAITCNIEGKKIIFIIFFSSEQDKIFLLLHELAHLFLDHSFKSGISDTAKELQANDFARYVIKCEKPKSNISSFAVGFLIACASFACWNFVPIYKNLHDIGPSSEIIQPSEQNPTTQSSTEIYSPSPQQTTTPEPLPEQPTSTETVYVTKTGKKYHVQDCYHISGRITRSLDLEEAKSTGYEACKSCKPDK